MPLSAGDRISLEQAMADSAMIGLRLRSGLGQIRREWAGPDLPYRGPADFVLRHGTLRRGAEAPVDAPRGALRHCYWNAILGALSNGWAYVEGFATHPAIVGDHGGRGEPVEHAWNEERGRVIDLTWPWSGRWAECGAYMGVPFSAARAHDCTWHGDGSVLRDERRGWGVLRDVWAGEESPGDLRGLVGVIAADMKAYGGESARLGVELERRACIERWPGAG